MVHYDESGFRPTRYVSVLANGFTCLDKQQQSDVEQPSAATVQRDGGQRSRSSHSDHIVQTARRRDARVQCSGRQTAVVPPRCSVAEPTTGKRTSSAVPRGTSRITAESREIGILRRYVGSVARRHSTDAVGEHAEPVRRRRCRPIAAVRKYATASEFARRQRVGLSGNIL